MATETRSEPQAGANALNTVGTMIGGTWIDGAGPVKEVRNPSTGEVVTNLPFSSSEQIDEAVAAAKAAQREWAKVPLAERADLLHKAIDAIGENADEICLWTSTEMGKTLDEAHEEVVDWITIPVSRWAIEAGRHLEGAAPATLENPDRRVTKIYQPIGVAGFISPWNFPVEMLINCTAALVMGNACVWKPSEWAPSGPAVAARVFAEALPDGLMNVIWGGPEEGEQLVTHDDVGQITFIGSTAVGERISSVAGVKRLLLELGGNGPFIVMDDADIDRAVDAAMDNCFFQAGQVCTAAERLLVHEDVHDEFVARMVEGAKGLRVGNQLDDSTDMGPLSDRRILDKVIAHVEDAREAGADILTGGENDGLFYQPTVLTGVTPQMRIAREETFGPVCPVIKIKSAEEALEIANDSEYGLSMAVFTSSLSTAYMLGESLEAGVVAINAGTNQVDNAAGFGGWKRSGVGRECGEDNLREYVRIKNLSFDVSLKSNPTLRKPITPRSKEVSPAIPTVQSLFSLDSKRFIVCGAGQGIGAASARALKALGADVVCVDMEADRAEAIAAEVEGVPLSLDLLSEDGVAELAEATGGEVDGIVDIIGGATRKSIADLDAASWDKDLDVNLRHAYLLGREYGPRLIERGGGSITFVASIVGSNYGTHVTPSYHAAKAALISWTRSLAVTYGPGGVRANTVSPGLVRTPRMEHVWEGTNRFEEVLERIALKRLQEPEDIANAAAFLATPAAQNITGQNLIVDGGITVRDPFYGDSKDESLV